VKFPSVRKILYCLLISSLLWLSACATDGGRSTSYPSSEYQEEEQDPMFWRMWQDQRGIGG